MRLEIDLQANSNLRDTLAFAPGAFEKVLTRAINKTLPELKEEMARVITEEVNLNISDVRKELKISKATTSSLEGVVSGSGSPGVDLMRFAVGQKRAPSTRRTSAGGYQPAEGIPVRIYRSRGNKVVKGSFIAKMGSGHVGVFTRNNLINPRTGKSRIKSMFGPSPVKIFASGRYDDHFEEFSEKQLQKNIEHEAAVELETIGLQ